MKTKTSGILFLLLIIGILIKPGIAFSQVPPHYNVLFIAVDDLNDKCSFLGDPQVVMPNMERLASHGMVFKNAYCQYPLCSPSRTSFLSGWRPDKTGISDNLTRPSSVLGPDVPYLPKYFHQYGYFTGRYGKILHGLFESDITWDYAEPPEANNGSSKTQVADTSGKAAGQWWVTDIADSVLEDGILCRDLTARMQQPVTQPFFYALGLHSPHSQFCPSLSYWNKNGDISVQELLPVNIFGKITTRTGNGSSNIIIPSTPANDLNDIPAAALTYRTPRTGLDWQRSVHAYYGEVAQMDAQLGLVLDEMDRQNLWANTVVVFFGDHGQHLGEHHGLWGKLTLFEESLHLPLIVCAPGKPPGTCSKLVELVDLYPTLTELCGLADQTGLEGSSFARLLDNPNQPWKRAAFSQVTRGRSIRTEQYRYNKWNSAEELYDINADPHEYTNLAGNSAYTGVLSQMRTILTEGWTLSKPPACTQKIFYHDADGDGYGSYTDTIHACSAPDGYISDTADCDDDNGEVHPGAAEICNGMDDNCNGLVDENVQSVFYHDADGDGYGSYTDTIHACSAPDGYISDTADCDDDNGEVHPGAAEICNGMDDNCNGLVDENVQLIFYHDADGDGYGSYTDTIHACSAPDGYISDTADCDDDNGEVHPGAAEICNGMDDNCNGLVDENVQLIFYHDADGDGYGNYSDTIHACSAPDGYVSDTTDCDDDNTAIHPGAIEICDGADNNCNGEIDEFTTFYADADGDGYGSYSDTIHACTPPDGYVSDSTDCDDDNTAVHPGAIEICDGADNNCNGEIDEFTTFYADLDGDGYGNPSDSIETCTAPENYVTGNTDCNDANADVHPGAAEICNGMDDNCDGQIDEGLLITSYADADGDGYGNPSDSIQACSIPENYVTDNTDCNDANAGIHPGASEICNGMDDDCDGQIDEGLLIIYYTDADGDGYGNPSNSIQACSIPEDYVTDNTDCNDANAGIHPGASEICNGMDDDCDGQIDEGLLITYYTDADGDGYGNPSNSTQACSIPEDYVTDNTDCNDANAGIHPGASEICNGMDDDCDGQIDEGLLITYYTDADGDGYGNTTVTIQSCSAPSGYAPNNTDCNDGNANIHPGATEVCNGMDDNCDGQIDEGVKSNFYRDADGDGYGNSLIFIQSCNQPAGYVTNNTDCKDANKNIHPGAAELCNGIDDNCNGQIDENKITATISPTGTVKICTGASALLTANSGPGISYQWLKNNVAVAGATQQTFTAVTAGNYKVYESNGFNCTASSAVTVISLLAVPNATITPLTNLDICVLGGAVLQANSGSGLTYQWTRNGIPMAGVTKIKCTTATPGTYAVITKNSNGCTKTSNSLIVTNSCSRIAGNAGSQAMEKSVSTSFLSLYPNPSTGEVAVTYKSNITGRIQLRVYDIPGQVLFSKTEQAVEGTNTFRLNLSNLTPGMYYVELRQGNGQNRVILKIEQ